MASLIFPLQFERQYAGPLDAHQVFQTSASRIAYLTSPLKYAGQIVSDLETQKAYQLSSDGTKWIELDFSLVNSLSANWNSVYSTVSALSSNWDSVYSTVSALSANWNSVYSTVSALSANWESTYNTVSALSANWSSVYSTVSPLSANWESTYNTVSALSAKWNEGGTFTEDLSVSIAVGKSFGRFVNGDIIPAKGKTPNQVLILSLIEPLAPTVALTSPTSIAFNQTNINNVLNFSHAIRSLGATVQTAVLEWRRNGTGSWTELSATTVSSGSYTHSMTDGNFATQPFNYRYTVTDSVGASAQATVNVTPASYSAPSIILSSAIAADGTAAPETNSTREKGNVNTNLTGTISRNSPYVGLVSYQFQYRVNGDPNPWNDIGTAVDITGNNTYNISSTNHNPTSNKTASTIEYRIKVVDEKQTSYSSVTTISFYNLIFYGASASAPTTSSEVRNLPSRMFTNGSNPFSLKTGTTHTKFTAAMPAPLTITNVIDIDASNANLTNSYVNAPFAVNDFGGTSSTYNVYTLSIATPYSPTEHEHRITR